MKYIIILFSIFIITGCFEFPPSGVEDDSSLFDTSFIGQSSFDSGLSIAANAIGNIYVTGYTTNNLDDNSALGQEDACLIKFGSDGNKRWSTQWGTSSSDNGADLIIDKAGNIYIIGTTSGHMDSNMPLGKTDIFISKFVDNGEKLWTKLIGTNQNDKGHAITIDNQENIYFLGDTNGSFDKSSDSEISNIVIGKMNKDGESLWIKQIENKNNSYSGDIIADTDGNIVVTERISDNSNNKSGKIKLMKLNSSGTELWKILFESENIFNGGFIDSDSKNDVYLGITTYSNVEGFKNKIKGGISLEKYNSMGSKLWKKDLLKSDELSSDIITSVKTDKNGDILLSGYTYKIKDYDFSDNNIIAAKFDRDGNQIWKQEFGSNKNDVATSVTVNNKNSIFLTGYTYGSMENDTQAVQSDIFLMNLDSNGNKIFSKQNSSKSRSIITSLIVKECKDEDKDYYYDIYMTGYTEGTFDDGVSRGKIDAFITYGLPYPQNFGTPEDDKATSMIVNENNIKFITGTTKGSTSVETPFGGDDIFLVLIEKSFTVWATQFGTDKDDNSIAVIQNSNSELLVVGDTEGSFNGNTSDNLSNIFIAKFTELGEKVWIKEFEIPKGTKTTAATSDKEGNIFITGYTNGSIGSNTNLGKNDIFLVKVDSNGNKVWDTQWGTLEEDKGNSLAIDSESNIYVTGFVSSDKGIDSNVFITKFNNDGSQIWHKNWGTDFDDQASAIAVDTNSDIFVTGNTKGNLYKNKKGECEIFITRLSKSGKTIKEYQFDSIECENSSAISVIDQYRIYIAGYAENLTESNITYESENLFVGYIYY